MTWPPIRRTRPRSATPSAHGTTEQFSATAAASTRSGISTGTVMLSRSGSDSGLTSPASGGASHSCEPSSSTRQIAGSLRRFASSSPRGTSGLSGSTNDLASSRSTARHAPSKSSEGTSSSGWSGQRDTPRGFRPSEGQRLSGDKTRWPDGHQRPYEGVWVAKLAARLSGPNPLLEDWRANLSPGSRHQTFRVFRQALAWGVARGLITRDASVGIKNPKRRRHERRDVLPFESWAEVEAVAAELPARFRVIPFLAVGCGLRPEELFGLHRADVDRQTRLLRIERRYTGGILKPGGKTAGSVRSIPLRQVVLDALDAMPPRIDTQILVPAARGGYIDIERFRHRGWAPALRAAGLDHRRIYDCRHTFATWAIEDGVPLWQLATIMGTSVVQIEDTYARWLKRTDDQLRAAFDAYDA